MPLSNIFCQIEVAEVPVISSAKTTGSSEFFSINDSTNSAVPSKSKSASNGCAVGLCPPYVLLT